MNTSKTFFNSQKLREAREARGLTINSLSELLSISRQSISAYEKGDQNPKLETIEKIAQVLNLPTHFFISPQNSELAGMIFYRSLASTTKTQRRSTTIKLGWLKEIVLYLKSYLDFLPVNLPNYDLLKDFRSITIEEIEKIAEETRKFWDLSNRSISDLTMLVENNGIIVNRGDFSYECIDAFSEWDKNYFPILVLNSNKQSAVRSRFDIAHELGHLILHNEIEFKDFTQSNLKILELQANYFAGAFLLPQSSFPSDFYYPSLDTFRTLKKKWKTSIAAMIFRCEQLGIINEKQGQRLWINYSRRGWKKGEPLDDEMKVEEPTFLRRCFEVLMDNNIQTPNDIRLNLPFNFRDIELLANLPEGFIENSAQINNLPEIKIKRQSNSENLQLITFKKRNL